jgi:hypothetical protein
VRQNIINNNNKQLRVFFCGGIFVVTPRLYFGDFPFWVSIF